MYKQMLHFHDDDDDELNRFSEVEHRTGTNWTTLNRKPLLGTFQQYILHCISKRNSVFIYYLVYVIVQFYIQTILSYFASYFKKKQRIYNNAPPPILTLTPNTQSRDPFSFQLTESTTSQNMKKCKITRIMARKIPHLACFLNLEHWNNDHFFSWYENINLVIICQYLFRFSHIAVSIIDFQKRKSLIANYIHVQICVYLIMI